MSDNLVFEPSAGAKARTLTTAAQYEEMYARSISDPDGFWGEQALRLDWIKPFTKVKNTSFAYPDAPRDILQKGAMDPKKCCTTCSKCTQIMRDHGRSGCVPFDRTVYAPIYREGRRAARERQA